MILANENAIGGGNYQIANSLRFQSASSQYLSRTPASAGNRKTWTWSAWVKRGQLGTQQQLFQAGTGTDQTNISIPPADTLQIYSVIAATVVLNITTTQVFRDPSAWYHIVVAIDTTQASYTNGVKVYVNGVQVTSFSTTTYTQNTNTYLNNNQAHWISSLGATQYYFDGYLAETNFIDAQQLTPSSFGTTDATSGQWVAKKYTGTYGTNGFYLPFSNGTSTTTLGADSSGNGNNWTLTNFTRSAGVSDCWMYDVPSGNGGASGTQPSSNYAVLNPLDKGTSTLTAGNLYASTLAAPITSTVSMSSGKFYAEVTYISNTVNALGVGIVPMDGYQLSIFSTGVAYYGNSGQKYINGVATAYGATFTNNDVIGVALDIDGGTITYYKNNVSQGVITLPAMTNGWRFSITTGNSTQAAHINFGQRSFTYTPPSGFKALCTANLPVATIKRGNKYMDATLYTGNSSTNVITNAAGFKPDLVWVKSRSAASFNALDDSVRGAGKALFSNATNAETTYTDGLLSFNSNGFTLGASVVADSYNVSPRTYVGWQWQAGQGTTSSNTNGSITSTVSVNATAGFSIVTYTGTGANATVGHGLGIAPAMIIFKKRNTAVTAGSDWATYHTSLGATKAISLNLTNAPNTNSVFFNNTAPTSSVFSVGSANDTNISGGTYVAYCFAEIAGFSKFGSYTGNGSADGPFVYLGFRPKFIMLKNTSVANNWIMYDTSRNTYNVMPNILYANLANAEAGGNAVVDALSNGFKLRNTFADHNGSGNTIVYMAFAESPFASSNAR